MALGYSISATIDLPYNSHNMKALLEKGSDLDFDYYQDKSDNTFELISVSIDRIVARTEQALSNNDVYATTIYLQQQTYVQLLFMNLENNLGIMFMTMSPEWSKSYIGSDVDIDLQRYAHVFLDLISDYKIIRMDIEND